MGQKSRYMVTWLKSWDKDSSDGSLEDKRRPVKERRGPVKMEGDL